MKEQDEIKDLFRDSFDGFEVTPPAGVKISIDQKISQIQTKSKLKWYFFTGISTLVLVFAVLFLNKEAATNSNTNLASNGKSLSEDQILSEKSQYSDKTQLNEIDTIAVNAKSVSNTNHPTQKQSNLNTTTEKSVKSFQKNKNTGKIEKKKTQNQFRNQNTTKEVSNSIKTKKLDPKIAGYKNKKSKTTKSKGNKSKSKKIKSSNFKIDSKNPDNLPKEAEITVVEVETKEEPIYLSIDTNALSKIDSIGKDVTDSMDENYQILDIAKVKNSWLFSLKTGTSIGINQIKSPNSISLKEKSSLFIQTEFAYYLNSKVAISSGLNYQNNFEIISQNKYILGDSVITDYNFIYVVDSNQTTVDSIAIPIYGSDSTLINLENSYQVYAIGLPIMFQYSFEFSPKLYLDLSAGAILNLQGSRTNYEYLNTSNRTVHQFGIKACLRTQLRYQFSNWGVSLNTNFGYDFKPVQSWENVSRKRSYLDLGVGIHYLIK